jgi:hypothetical protein
MSIHRSVLVSNAGPASATSPCGSRPHARRRHLPISILCALLLGAVGACPGVERIIFDSDMSSDHDDAADIAVLHALADLGECEILACMASSRNGATAVAFNAINAYYGRPGIPCGRRPDCGGPGEYPGTLISEFPHPLYATWQDPPLCLDLYRQVLAAQPDHSVSIVTTGYLNNLEALMKSGPDQRSALNGMDLIRQKVKLLSCAAGCYPKGNEFNLRVEPGAAYYVVNNWPTAAFYDGYDVGQAIYSGAGLEQTGRDNPIRRAFELTFFGPYPTWGQLMIYYAVRTPESRILWRYDTTGHNNTDATGYNWWSTETDPAGAQEQGYMLEIERFPVQQAIETLVMNSGAPRSKGTVKPPNQPSNLRGTIVGGDRIDLQWTDNSWNETGFTVERRVNGVFTPIATLGAGATSYSDTGLSTVANQNYRVQAINAIGGSAYATVAVYTGWTEINRSNPGDHTPIYAYYQNNLNWIRGPDVCEHLVVNNDSAHGQDLTIDVMVAAQGAYGKYHVYFFYQDADNWYRLSAGSQGEGQQNNVSRFEKCVAGTITQIGAAGTGVNLGNGCHLITWRITASHTGALTFANNNNPTGNASGPLHAVLAVSDTLSFTGGRIALGTNIGQPVWDDFRFDTTGGGGATPVAPTITGQPADATVTAGQTATFTVAASGSAPLTYRWKRGATSVGSDSATLSIANAQAGDAGSYTCTVGNSAGTAISRAATLTVNAGGGGLDPLIAGTTPFNDGGGSYGGSGGTADKAYDGSTATFYDAAVGTGAYTGIDVGAGKTATVTAIRYWARSGWSSRMPGGVFEGSNSQATGYVTLGTVAAASDTAWTTLTVSGAAAYRYLRYRGPANGFCNVAEIEFRGAVAVASAWNGQGVGSTGVAGSWSQSNGVITVTGSGADVWGMADAFQFVAQPLTGDGSIVAHVLSVQDTDPWAKAGVMVREGTAADARHAFCFVTPGNGAAFQRRPITAGPTSHTCGSRRGAPRWVRLVRSGAAISGYESADGVTWTLVGSATIGMTNPVQVGLAVTSHDDAATCAAVFDQVLITPSGSG